MPVQGGFTTDGAPPAVARPTLAPGALVAGRYRLASRLGSGGGGTVWRCVDEKLASAVALKILAGDFDLDRWRREVAMARRIAHRNVCRVHDLGDDGDLHFVTMELVEGASLRTRIRPDLPAEEARALVLQIVAGVAAIHAAGVVHRDLKPENVVVATDGRAVIVDFGLAREPRSRTMMTPAVQPPSTDDIATVREAGPTPMPAPMPPIVPPILPQTITNVGFAVGTPRYMSPEQAAGATVDARVDVWALGLVAHELLAGAMPEIVPEGRRIAPIVDDKLPGAGDILRRCLAIDPAARFADARALYAALATKPRRRWPFVVGGLAAAGAIAGIAVLARGGDDARPSMPVSPLSQTAVPYRMLQVTTTDAEWPEGAPISVALDHEAKRFAYTTGEGKLFVRDLGGGSAQPWTEPKVHSPGKYDDGKELFVATFAAGWFSDGTVAELGATWRGEWHLVRTARDGTYTLLHRAGERFAVAVSSTDRVALGIDREAVLVLAPGETTPQSIVKLGDHRVLALAWSPDGTRLAIARMQDGTSTATVQVTGTRGATVDDVWRGRTGLGTDTLLAWLDDDRLALGFQDPDERRTTLATIAVGTHAVTVRETLDAFLGAGTAAHGVVLLLRGTARSSVQVGDKDARKLLALHNPGVEAGSPAGWTPDGRVVFAMGDRGKREIVRAKRNGEPERWPGTSPGDDVPDSVIDDGLIVHHVEGDRVVVERLSPTGERTKLAEVPRSPLGVVVRCAGDRTAPCVLVELQGDTVRVIDIDPSSGARRATLHERRLPDRARFDAALTPDGARLAIVAGATDATIIDLASGKAERSPSAGGGASLTSVAFGANEELWAAMYGLRGRLYALATFTRLRDHYLSSPNQRGPFHDALRWYTRPVPSTDGTQVAVTVREFHLDIWRADGL